MDYLEINSNRYFVILSYNDCLDIVILGRDMFEYIISDGVWEDIVQLPFQGMFFFDEDPFISWYLEIACSDDCIEHKIEDLHRVKKEHFKRIFA